VNKRVHYRIVKLSQYTVTKDQISYHSEIRRVAHEKVNDQLLSFGEFMKCWTIVKIISQAQLAVRWVFFNMVVTEDPATPQRFATLPCKLLMLQSISECRYFTR